MSGLSPENVAAIVSREITGHIEKIASGEEADKAAKEEIITLYNRACEVLATSGCSAVVGTAQSDNEHHFNSLLVWSTSARMQRSMNSTDPDMALVSRFKKEARKSVSEAPHFINYIEDIPEPYRELFAAWFILDVFIQRGRYDRMKQAAGKLLGQTS